MALLSKFIANQRQKKDAPYIKGDVLELGCGSALALRAHGSQITNYCGINLDSKLIGKLQQEHSTFISSDPGKTR